MGATLACRSLQDAFTSDLELSCTSRHSAQAQRCDATIAQPRCALLLLLLVCYRPLAAGV